MPAILTYKKPCDATQMAVHYLRMAFLDMEDGELDPKHPETLLPYSQYLRMSERGVFGSNGADMPFPNGGWLITFAEAERWLQSKDIHVNFDGVRADLERMRAEGLDDWPSHEQADTPRATSVDAPQVTPTEKQPAPASEAGAPAAANSWQAEARKIADERFHRDTSNKCRDSLEGYSKRVAKELTNRGIKGPHGKPLSSGTVKREALQGPQWWQNKAK